MTNKRLFDYTRISRLEKSVIYDRSGYNGRMPLYTRTGDDGTTGLLGEDRVSKDHPRIEALGALDEASAALGLARASCLAPQTSPILRKAQRDLYKVMAEVAATPENADKFKGIDATRVTWIEEQADEIQSIVSMPKEFILPGDTPSGAALSMARAVVRRAERRVTELFTLEELTNTELLRYLNRLSSLCFVLELLENQAAGRSTSLAKE
jgi:cob(I)alamin adenosyltransferase